MGFAVAASGSALIPFYFVASPLRNTNAPYHGLRNQQQLESVSLIVRELMIEMLYHGVSKELTFPKYSPENLLRRIDNEFTHHTGEDENTLNELESAVANHICNAAKTVTANISGHADIVILDAGTLGRTYMVSPSPYTPTSPQQVIPPDSLTGKCINDRKYFIANDVHDPDRSSPEVQEALKKYNEFDRSFCKCIMLAPIEQDDGTVRAVLRLTSPEEGYFLDEQAKAVRDLRVFALQCLLRLDERRQRAGMNAALKFYAAAQSDPGWRHFPSLFREIVSAFRAKWGTYWPVDPQQPDKLVIVGERGYRFSPDNIKEVKPSDPECGIRTGECNISGISALIHLLNQQKKDVSTFVCVHVLKPHTRPDASDAEYLLRFYSKERLDGKLREKCRKLTDDKDFWIAEWQQGENIPVREGQALNLNENTTREIHSRIAFAVKEEGIVRAIVWLVFACIHHIEWWERNYIDGFSTVLGRLEHNYSLQMIHRGFRHLIPGVCDVGSGKASMIHDWIKKKQKGRKKKLLYERDRDTKPLSLDSLTSDIETSFACLHCKADEVRVLQHAGSDSDSGTDTLQSSAVEKYVDEAIGIVSQFLVRPERFYKKFYTLDETRNCNVPSVYLSVLWNLLDNAKRHGIEKVSDKNLRLAVIWIDGTNPEYVETVVANTGKKEKDDEKNDDQGGVGLSVARILLRETGGRLDEWLSKETILSRVKAREVSRARNSLLTASLNKCDTFFSFQCPKIQHEVR